MFGINTKNLYLINGTFTFSLWVMDTHIKIGCQLKTKKEWLEITEEDAAADLGDDGTMWEHREFIRLLCNENPMNKRQGSNVQGEA